MEADTLDSERIQVDKCTRTRMDDTSEGKDADNVEICDAVDGFFGHRLGGSYNPRGHELEDWGTGGPAAGSGGETDAEECIYHLLEATSPATTWRPSLMRLLRSCTSEPLVRKSLTFLHANIKAVLDVLEDGSLEAKVNVDIDSAPNDFCRADWIEVLAGLNLEVTSPAASGMEHAQVTMRKTASRECFTGFCFLLQQMLELSWTNLQLLIDMEDVYGRELFEMVAVLCAGCGMDESTQNQLEKIEHKYPSVVKSLGFLNLKKKGLFQWEKPTRDNEEFQNVFVTLHGLFKSTQTTSL